jgi:paraquat-inducible protein B
VADVSAVAASARQLMSRPHLRQTLDDCLALAGSDLRRLLARLDQRVGPLADSLQGTLGATKRTAEQWGGEVDRVGQRGRPGRPGGRQRHRHDGPRRPPGRRGAAHAAQRAARRRRPGAHRQRAAQRHVDDSGLMQQFERAAQDMARASRAVRDLADLLERQPEALIRGRSTTP